VPLALRHGRANVARHFVVGRQGRPQLRDFWLHMAVSADPSGDGVPAEEPGAPQQAKPKRFPRGRYEQMRKYKVIRQGVTLPGGRRRWQKVAIPLEPRLRITGGTARGRRLESPPVYVRRRSPSMRFEGLTAVVSGGASGLGRAVVERVAACGGKAVVLDVQEEAGRELARRHGAAVRFVTTDVRDEAAVERGLEEAADFFGRSPALAVSCAGVLGAGRVLAREGPMKKKRKKERDHKSANLSNELW
jgi:hypothetical protein